MASKSETETSTEVRSPTSTKTSTDAVTRDNVTVTGGAGDGDTNVTIHFPPASSPRSSMESYATKPMAFSFKKPGGATPMETAEGEAPAAEGPSEAMTPEELGASVKASMNAGGPALYEAICKIIESHGKG